MIVVFANDFKEKSCGRLKKNTQLVYMDNAQNAYPIELLYKLELRKSV